MTAGDVSSRAADLASESRFLSLCRIGFVGRGLLYILIGFLALGTGRTEDLTGALEYLGHGSGRLLLIAITAGMAAYGLWRLADGAFGIERPGSDPKAMRRRVAVSGIGLIYLFLAYKGLRILLEGSAGPDGGPQQQADSVLHLPGGPIILGLAALALIGAGLAQLRKAMKCSFLHRLDLAEQVPLVKWLGRIGYTARGLVFLLIGGLVGRAALAGRSSEAGGMEEALDLLSGPLLYAVAIGLMLFGAFSIIEGLFRRIKDPPLDEMKRKIEDKVAS